MVKKKSGAKEAKAYYEKQRRDREPGFSEACVKRFDEYLDTTGAVIDSAADEVIKLLESEFINPEIVEEVKGKLEFMKTELSTADINYKDDLEETTDFNAYKIVDIIKRLEPQYDDACTIMEALNFEDVEYYADQNRVFKEVMIQGLTQVQKDKLRAFIEAELYPAYNDQVKYVSGL